MDDLQVVSVTHFDNTGTLYFDVFVSDGDAVVKKRLSVKEYVALFEEPVQAKNLFEKLTGK